MGRLEPFVRLEHEGRSQEGGRGGGGGGREGMGGSRPLGTRAGALRRLRVRVRVRGLSFEGGDTRMRPLERDETGPMPPR